MSGLRETSKRFRYRKPDDIADIRHKQKQITSVLVVYLDVFLFFFFFPSCSIVILVECSMLVQPFAKEDIIITNLRPNG